MSDWEFNVDFNDWGHITGTRWIWSENGDSTIPAHYGKLMASEIYLLFKKRNIRIESYSDAVDNNVDLEKNGLVFRKKSSESLFSKDLEIYCQFESGKLKGEHLYPVISLIKRNGFVNVKSIPIKDIDDNSTKFRYEVEQVVINGTSFFEIGDAFWDSCEVYITYHDIIN